jgi:hypothetical protein
VAQWLGDEVRISGNELKRESLKTERKNEKEKSKKKRDRMEE